MANTQAISRRIRSVKNAKQITKAMEVVAAARMRKVQSAVAQVRTYGQIAEQIMQKIAGTPDAQNHPYFKESSIKGRLYIIVTSDRGLAGAFNSNLFNTAHRLFLEDKSKGISSSVIVFGRKGARHFAHLEHIKLIGDYEDVADNPDVNVFAPVIDTLNQGFGEQFGEVTLIYTEFKSSLTQTVTSMQLLPIHIAPLSSDAQQPADDNKVYEFEPSIESVLDES